MTVNLKLLTAQIIGMFAVFSLALFHAFMALFGRDRLPARSTFSRFLATLLLPI